MIIDTDSLDLARKKIQASKRPIVVTAHNDEFNRKILEYGRFDVLLSIEKGKKRDSLRQIDSGLNEVVARIAAKNKIALGIDLTELKTLDVKEKARRLTRIRQNIRIAQKTGTRLLLYNSLNTTQDKSLLISLGASSMQAAQAISF